MTFDLSKDNYDYLVKMSGIVKMKIGPLLNILLDIYRENEMEINAEVERKFMVNKKIEMIEKNILEQTLILDELKVFRNKFNLDREENTNGKS